MNSLEQEQIELMREQIELMREQMARLEAQVSELRNAITAIKRSESNRQNRENLSLYELQRLVAQLEKTLTK